MNILFAQIILAVVIPIIIYYEVRGFQRYWELIERNARQIGRTKQKEPKWKPYPSTEEKEHLCPNCGQPCTKEEYEHGYCLDCNQVELFDDFEEENQK